MKAKASALEPQARAVLRIIAAYMLLLHGLREVFGLIPAKTRGPGSFMPLDHLGTVGGVLLLVLGTLLLIGWFARSVMLLLSLQCFIAYFYASAPRNILPIRSGGIDTLTYAFIFLYLAAVGAGAWSVDGMLQNKKVAYAH